MFSFDNNTPYSWWDLTDNAMSDAITLTFQTNNLTDDGLVDNYAYYHTSSKYAILDSTFKIYLTEGNIYSFTSASYLDPFSLVIADKYGNALISNDESNDGSTTAKYTYDDIIGVVPEKSDWYYISASWQQGSYYKDCYIMALEIIPDDSTDTNGSVDTDTSSDIGTDTTTDTNTGSDTGANTDTDPGTSTTTDTNNNDSSHIVVQRGVVSAGSGNDDYIISPVLTDSNTSITITDDQGNNRIHLIEGLTITSSKVASNAIQLELSNGADITILGADNFTFMTGGNPLIGQSGSSYSQNSFVTDVLNISSGIPSSGITTGGSVTINDDDSSQTLTPDSNGNITASDGVKDIVTLSKSDISSGAYSINNFNTSEDTLKFTGVTGGSGNTLNELDGDNLYGEDISVQYDPFQDYLLVNFGNDNQDNIVYLTISGVSDASEVAVILA